MIEESKNVSDVEIIEPKVDFVVEEKPKFKLGNITTGLFFIILGGIFLLNTLGFLSWGVWGGFFVTMLKFWPILIISVGVRILLGSNTFLKIVSDLVWLLLLLLAFGISIVNYTGDSSIRQKLINRLPFLVTINQKFNTNNTNKSNDIKITRNEGDTYKNIDINLNVVAGEFNLKDMDIVDYLTLNSEYSENGGVPKVSENKTSDTLSLDFKQEFKPMVFDLGSKSKYTMVIGEKTPVKNLSLNLTAGESDINIDKVNVRTTDIKMTAGDSTLTFSEASLPESISVKLVAGELTLNLPTNIGVEINNKSVAGESKYNNTKITENGTSQFNTDKAKKIVINIEQTAGDISIITK